MSATYRVRGYCYVPMEVEMTIEAESEIDAVTKALKSDWRKRIVSESQDESAAFDWVPFADEVKQ